ncbi:MAG: ATP-binding cassette domain-containing protein [Chitinophagales bacterium]|nr:ATP-binding cassette domain-containing protein [Chitinophagales bacterium]
MSELLNIQNLNKSFDGVAPVKDVSFAVSKQSITLITGENGAGKTTLFNLITGLVKPTKGNITFNGNNITGKSSLEIARQGIIRLYQQPRLFKNLLVWENLVSAAHNNTGNSFLNLIFKPKTAKQEDETLEQKALDLLTKFGLHELSNQTAGELSYGQQKLISFCMIAMNGTQLALLDEPFAGLNPQTIERFSNMILQMRSEGITFLIIEHNINEVLKVADGHIEMKDGKIKTINDIATV